MADLFPNAKLQFDSILGLPLVGGKLYTYAAGTNTPKTTWQDSAGATPNTNPIILDARGECTAYGTGTYKFVLKDALDNTIWTQDNITVSGYAALVTALAASSGSSTIGFIQSGSGAVARTVQSKLREIVSVTDFGADPTGVADSTTAANNAITSLASGGVVFFPPGNYKITGTLLIAANGVLLKGAGNRATKLTFTGLATDCIKFQGSGQIEGVGVADMWLVGSSLTGGHMINMQIVAYGTIDNVNIDNPWNGFLCYQTNTIVYRNMVINYPHGAYAGKWDSPTANNSSALTLENVTMQGGYLGADGFIWDGWATSLRMKSVAILSFRYGMRVQNTRNSATAYPSYAIVLGLEIDGASTNALVIDAGFNFKFVCCDITNTSGASGQGGADGASVVINPDLSYSITRLIDFAQCQIGTSRQQGIYIDAKDITLTGCTVHDVSKQGVNAFAATELGPNAQDVKITGGQSGVVYGDGLRASYGILINAAATRVAITGVDVTQVNLAGIQNNNPTDVTIIIVGCPGFRTNSGGSATIPMGSTSIVVPHGLAATPLSVIVSAQQLTSVGTTHYGTISGGNILLGMSAAQATDILFCWSASLGPSN